MKNILLLIVVGAVIIGLRTCHKADQVNNDLEGYLDAEKATFKVGEPIQLKLRIKNISKKTIYLPKTEWDGAWIFYALDDDRNQQTLFAPVPITLNGNIIVELKPGEEIEVPKATGELKGNVPQKLSITVWLEITAKNAPPDYHGWTGIMPSNRLVIEIVP